MQPCGLAGATGPEQEKALAWILEKTIDYFHFSFLNGINDA
jgi:hypothetical protein